MEDAPQSALIPSADAEHSPDGDSPVGEARCLNCGTIVSGRFCPECGQQLLDPNPTLRELLHELAEGFLNWDGKLLATVRLLVTSPGTLTQDYLAGRRAPFISPLRVYLTCSFLFFFVKAVLPDAPLQIRSTTTKVDDRAAAPSSMKIGVVREQRNRDELTEAQLDSLAKSGRGVSAVWYRHFAKVLRKKGALSAAVSSNLPRMMFVLVPMFAALVAFVFRRRGMRYPQHLAFALHVHAFLFLALILTLVPRLVKNGAIDAIFVATSFALIATHLVVATRRVYAVSTGGAIARSALLSAAYFVIYLVTFLALFIGAVLLL